MKCADCRWHFPLLPAHDPTQWRNCLALPYPLCTETMTRMDQDCIVPDKFVPVLEVV